MAGTAEQVARVEVEIAKLQSRVKAIQEKLARLAEKKKQLQERALLEKISAIAPDYHDAQELLELLQQISRHRRTKEVQNTNNIYLSHKIYQKIGVFTVFVDFAAFF